MAQPPSFCGSTRRSHSEQRRPWRLPRDGSGRRSDRAACGRRYAEVAPTAEAGVPRPRADEGCRTSYRGRCGPHVRVSRAQPSLSERRTHDQTKTRWSPSGSFRAQEVEATTGFEPVNRGFADLRVEPLHHVASASGYPRASAPVSAGTPASRAGGGCPSRIRTSVHGSKVRCPTTRRRGIARGQGYGGPWTRSKEGNGAEDGTRTRDPHLGKVMLYQLSHFRSDAPPREMVPRARIELATPRFSVACSTD